MAESKVRDVEIAEGPFANPLKDWRNDDLMLEEETRVYWQQNRPRAFRVLDWPELRESFQQHNLAANRGKRTSRVQGLLSVALAGLGVITLALEPVIPNKWEGEVTLAALLLMSAGGALGLLHWVILKSRHVWLGHRYWTERLRQMHFQSLVANIDLVCEAMTDDRKLEELQTLRRRWLGDFTREATDPRVPLNGTCEDRTDGKAWMHSEWRDAKNRAVPSETMDELMDALSVLRLGIQLMYARKINLNNIYSPKTRGLVLRLTGVGATVAVISFATAGWISWLAGGKLMAVGLGGWTVAAAVVSAFGIMARAMDDGLQTEADAERYRWYEEALENISEQFEAASVSGKVAKLRQLEQTSYQELRWFLRTHAGARFLG